MENITGRRIKALRKHRHITQTELAESIDLQKTTISRIENGSALPGRETITNIADYFNVSVDYLLGNIDTFHHVDEDTLKQYKQLFDTIMNKPKEDQTRIIKLLTEILK